ncbi:serine/threonine-protein kinase haspin-like [Clytia hemisphaerica]|uniref:serine/threonine-protein kinase haspin-like n=1 Tax=Clytia hemisphaerica TaxID=252671 RepID=UPI0034D4F80A
MLVQLWEAWKEDPKNECYNENPGIFDKTQKYVVFEYEHGGEQLESFKPFKANWTVQLVFNVLQQINLILAVGEEFLEFEHRDLHAGNILIREIEPEKDFKIKVGGKVVEVPNKGLLVTIIDFTMSRLQSEDCVIFTDLSTENDLFAGTGDAPFDVIRKIREDNGNEWKSFDPKSNVRWVKYITDILYERSRQRKKVKRLSDGFQDKGRWVRGLLEYKSCYEIVTENSFLMHVK